MSGNEDTLVLEDAETLRIPNIVGSGVRRYEKRPKSLVHNREADLNLEEGSLPEDHSSALIYLTDHFVPSWDSLSLSSPDDYSGAQLGHAAT